MLEHNGDYVNYGPLFPGITDVTDFETEQSTQRTEYKEAL